MTKRVTARPTTTNVLTTFWRATEAELTEGREWYSRARDLSVALAEKHWMSGLGTDDFAGEIVKAAAVVAVLSPRLAWIKNVELAQWIYREYAEAVRDPKPSWWVKGEGSAIDRFPGLKANGLKAARILLGEDPATVVSGPKVTAFWYAISNPSDPRGIVIDRHAFDVAAGRVLDDTTRGVVLGRKGAYESFVRAYERAALALQDTFPGITATEVQAVTWVTWRRLKKEA